MAQIDVRLDHVTKRFDGVVAVDDLSLEVERGSFFSLLGPSGSGKTTTLRVIGGFEEPTAGSVYLGETDVTDLPPYRRDVNTVFQSYALFPHLDVFENVAFGLRRRRVARDEIRRRVGEMLELVELPGYERRKPRQLSGGQQQRVALARALINRPRVLLLDEPLGALDLRLRRQMQLELKRIQHEVGITFIYVTHDQEEAMTMSDRIAVMRNGRVEQLGEPQALYEHPATEFVAGFLGTSNLLDGRVEGRAGELLEMTTVAGRVRSALAPESAVPTTPGSRVRIGVRPEKLSLWPASTNGADAGNGADGGRLNALRAVVVNASYLGVSTEYTVRTPDGAQLTVYTQNSELNGVVHLSPGTPVEVRWRPEHTFVVADAPARPQEGETDV